MKKRKNDKAPISLTISQLDSFIEYLFTENPNIKRKQLKNLEQLFSVIDERIYETDEELASRFLFIKNVLDGRLRLKLNNHKLLLTHSINALPKEYRELMLDFACETLEGNDELNEKEIDYINKFTIEHLNYYFVFRDKEEIQDIMEELELGSYSDLGNVVERMKTSFQRVLKGIRMTDADEAENLSFSFLSKNFSENLDEIANQLKKPSRFLNTGIQGFDKLLGGGFESGRCYLWLGAPSSGKSILLLTLAYQIAKYNQDLQTLQEGKKKAVVYLTQENSKKETVERLWNIAVSNANIRDFSNEEIENVFKKQLPFSDDSECDLIILYRKNKKISTDDLYTIFQELEDDGYEIVALVHDYAKRIRPSFVTGDLRIDLGEVVNDFTVRSAGCKIVLYNAK